MPLIFISSESKTSRKQLAEDLSKKLGCPCLCREDLIYEATQAGIPVGKLEMAMVKSPAMNERVARQKERYLAFITSNLCERAMKQDFVYHGRAGHMLLQGISHIIKVRLVVDRETRIAEAMENLKLSREKADEYVKNIDEDIERWVRYFYNVERDEPSQYDVVVNLENMSMPNTSAMLCYLADLPDFKPTPASQRALESRSLEVRARKKLALDPQTANADLKVRADEGVVTVTYMPRQPGVAEGIDVHDGQHQHPLGSREVRPALRGLSPAQPDSQEMGCRHRACAILRSSRFGRFIRRVVRRNSAGLRRARASCGRSGRRRLSKNGV
jgi:cytidylate kinase